MKKLILATILFGATSIKITAAENYFVPIETEEAIADVRKYLYACSVIDVRSQDDANKHYDMLNNIEEILEEVSETYSLEQAKIILNKTRFYDENSKIELTPLMLAVNNSDLSLIKLLSKYSDLDEGTETYSNFFDFLTTFSFENRNDFLTYIFNVVLKNQPRELLNILVNQKNCKGETPLNNAFNQPDYNARHILVSMFLHLGADPLLRNIDGTAPIFLAIKKGYIPTIAELYHRNPMVMLQVNNNGERAENVITVDEMIAVIYYTKKLEGTLEDLQEEDIHNLSDDGFSSSDDDVE